MTTARTYEVAMTADPIDLIVTGFSTEFAERIGATSVWLSETCCFVDCDETVFYSPHQHDAAIDVYMMREVDDDRLLVCCRDHEQPNNFPAIVGLNLYDARRFLTSNGGHRGCPEEGVRNTSCMKQWGHRDDCEFAPS